MGDGKVFQFLMNDFSFVFFGGVVVQLVLKELEVFIFLFVFWDFDGKKLSGIIFCYFFLLIQSGLVVYINGLFVVIFNRCYLFEKFEDDKFCYGVEWNDVFM